MSEGIFEILILNGRPAAGKSEIIDFLRSVPLKERIERFHIGELDEFDDFPILWDEFENDDIMESMGHERLVSDTSFDYKGKTCKWYIFKDKFHWNFLIDKLCFNYLKKIKINPQYHKKKTAIFEFARGVQHGGWRQAYKFIYDEVLKKASTMYIDITWEESLKRNRRRYIDGREDSILNHTMADMYLEYVYKDSDWDEFSGENQHHLSVRDHKIPYAVFENVPEKTDDPKLIAPHLEEVMNKIWKIRKG